MTTDATCRQLDSPPESKNNPVKIQENQETLRAK